MTDLEAQLKEWHPESWRRWTDPRTNAGGLLNVNRAGGSYYWHVEICKPGDESGHRELIKMVEGRCDSLADAQAAADAAWLEHGPIQMPKLPEKT